MKRKVNKSGKTSLTISLPSKWARNYQILHGDEINVEEKGSILEISPEKTTKKKLICNIDNFDRTSLVSYLRYHYRNAADLIYLNFTNPKIYFSRINQYVNVSSVINQEVSRLMGMEIVEMKQNSCLIRCMINEDLSVLKEFVHKIFSSIIYSFEELINSIENKQSLNEIQKNHDSLTNFIGYCLRFLNRYRFSKRNKLNILISELESLELIMDIIESVAYEMREREILLSKKSIPLIKDMKSIFLEFSEFYFVLNIKKVSKLNSMRINMENKLQTDKNLSVNDKLFLSKLSVIFLILRGLINLRVSKESMQRG